MFKKISYRDPQASGLMELTDLLKFNYATTLTIDIDVGLPALQITSPYDLDLDLILTVLNDTSLSLVGIGDLIFGASDLFLNFHGKGLAPVIGFMRLNELDVDLGFKNLEFSLACLEINGTPNDLGHFAGLIQSVFDLVWTDDNKVLVNEMIRCAIDDLISVRITIICVYKYENLHIITRHCKIQTFLVEMQHWCYCWRRL